MARIDTIKWTGESVRIIDQKKLPGKLVYLDCKDLETLAKAIENMNIRGAPAIGVAAAYGVVLGVSTPERITPEEFEKRLTYSIKRLRHTRPTASNLFWALERMRKVAKSNKGRNSEEMKRILLKEADRIFAEDMLVCRRIGENGARLIKDQVSLLTHCNAGALATAGFGTALEVIYTAKEQGKRIKVFADETRPLLQGARLTAWELMQNKIDVTVICEAAAGTLMRTGQIDYIIVGADRIAANGDVANKVGTYMMAVLASRHNIPFYVAAPVSTLDLSLENGDQIPIEERNPEEVTRCLGVSTAPEGVGVFNPAFDITPNELIGAIISEKGVAYRPYKPVLSEWKRNEES